MPWLDQCCYLCWMDPQCPHTAELHTRRSLTVTNWLLFLYQMPEPPVCPVILPLQNNQATDILKWAHGQSQSLLTEANALGDLCSSCFMLCSLSTLDSSEKTWTHKAFVCCLRNTYQIIITVLEKWGSELCEITWSYFMISLRYQGLLPGMLKTHNSSWCQRHGRVNILILISDIVSQISMKSQSFLWELWSWESNPINVQAQEQEVRDPRSISWVWFRKPKISKSASLFIKGCWHEAGASVQPNSDTLSDILCPTYSSSHLQQKWPYCFAAALNSHRLMNRLQHPGDLHSTSFPQLISKECKADGHRCLKLSEMDLKKDLKGEIAKQPHRQGLRKRRRKRWSGRKKLHRSRGEDPVC